MGKSDARQDDKGDHTKARLHCRSVEGVCVLLPNQFLTARERANWGLLQKKPRNYIVLSYEFLGPPADPIPETIRSQSRHMACMTV